MRIGSFVLASGLALAAMTPPVASALPRPEAVFVADAGACRDAGATAVRPSHCAGAADAAGADRKGSRAAPVPIPVDSAGADRSARPPTPATPVTMTQPTAETSALPELPPALLLFGVCLLIALSHRRPAD